MKSYLRQFAAITLLAPLVGCAAGGRMPSLRPDTSANRVAPAADRMALADIAREINQNAAPVEALSASTTVSVQGKRFGGGLSGQLALERPRNFKLKLERGFGTPEVDVGSNENEFWFWTKEQNQEKAIYVGRYGDDSLAANGVLFHPDWLVEAMGLRPIASQELAKITTEPGRDPNTLVLKHLRSDGRGGTQQKLTVVDRATGQIKQHVFFGADGKPVAYVMPSSFRAINVAGATAEDTQTVELPEQVRLKLSPTRDQNDQLVMDIALRDYRINPKFTATNRQALFTVPEYHGYQVVDVSAPTRDLSTERTSRAHESRPVPPVTSEFQLGEPAPLAVEGASLYRRDPMPLEADLGPVVTSPGGTSSIVKPDIPTAPLSEQERRPDPATRRIAADSRFGGW